MNIAAGSRLGPYEIHSKLGEGGRGEVYLAEDTRLRRRVAEVALKILPAELPSPKLCARGGVNQSREFMQASETRVRLSPGSIRTCSYAAGNCRLLRGAPFSNRYAAAPVIQSSSGLWGS